MYSPVLTQENKQMSCPESRKFPLLIYFSFRIHIWICYLSFFLCNQQCPYNPHDVSRMNDSAYKGFITITPLFQINIIIIMQWDMTDWLLKLKHWNNFLDTRLVANILRVRYVEIIYVDIRPIYCQSLFKKYIVIY